MAFFVPYGYVKDKFICRYTLFNRPFGHYKLQQRQKDSGTYS